MKFGNSWSGPKQQQKPVGPTQFQCLDWEYLALVGLFIVNTFFWIITLFYDVYYFFTFF